MKTKIKKLAPVGFSVKTELVLFALSYIFATAYSILLFCDRFFNLGNYMLTRHYEKNNSPKIYPEGTLAANFNKFIDDIFLLFLVSAMLMCVFCILHITYHYQNSKSIYLMKRLPKKSEYYVRCLTLPLTGIILCAVTVVLLVNIFYLIYITQIRPEFLPENHIESLWRYFVWIRK